MNKTSLAFLDVTFGFSKDKPLFEKLCFSIENNSETGKIIALMGSSGVGKTTFCNLALGIHKKQGGTIKFIPDNASISVIPQKGVIFEELNIEENISCLRYSQTLGSSFDENKISHAIQLLDLTHVIKNATSTNQLSGGEAQRVMLARIQTINCDILILDEPCSFLDNRVKDSFLSGLRATVDESKILALMVTHVWDEVQSVADEVIFFNKVQEKPVTLHPANITKALDRPPTIDALYGIFWPSCILYEINDANRLVDNVIQNHPDSAQYIGLYPGDILNNVISEKLTNKLWNQMEAEKYIKNKLPRERCISSAFYDRDGILLL